MDPHTRTLWLVTIAAMMVLATVTPKANKSFRVFVFVCIARELLILAMWELFGGDPDSWAEFWWKYALRWSTYAGLFLFGYLTAEDDVKGGHHGVVAGMAIWFFTDNALRDIPTNGPAVQQIKMIPELLAISFWLYYQLHVCRGWQELRKRFYHAQRRKLIRGQGARNA